MAKRKSRRHQAHVFHEIAALFQVAGLVAIIIWIATSTDSAIVHTLVLLAGLASIGRVMYTHLEEGRTASFLEWFACVGGAVLVVGAIQHLF